MAAERVGAAKRRRDRQLRAFRRHELLTVRMELAAALHHSAQRVEARREVEEPETHVGLRTQKTPPPGTQPACLREPGLQLVVEHAACPCSSGVPPLPGLSGDCSLDDVAVQFLVAQTLLEREQKALAVKEEEEELVADLASKEQRLLVETERFARSWVRNSPLSPPRSRYCIVVRAKTALAKREITASPGRYTNTGRAAVLHDPGGASDPVHLQ